MIRIKISFLLLLILVGLSTFLKGQIQRVILFEQFTGEDCGPCAAINPSVNNLLKNNEGSVIALKYQRIVSSSSPNVLYSQTSSESSARTNYYSVSSIPYGIMDGNVKKGNAGSFNQNDFDDRSQVQSSFKLNVNHDFSINTDSIYITVDIEAVNNFTAQKPSSLRLRVAMVERTITLRTPAVNGEKEFVEVMRKMYPNPAGTTLPQNWANGQKSTYTFKAKIPSYIFDKNQIAVVAFIQDDDNKEVHQAARSVQKKVRVDAKLLAVDVPFLNCKKSSVKPLVTLKNFGTDYLTSLELDVKLNGTLIYTKLWTGTLAPEAETFIAMDSITKNPGVNSLEVISRLPNGENDQNNFNDTVKCNFAFPESAQPIPFEENFDAGIPSSFLIENPDDGSTWETANYSAFGNGSKSALIGFYEIPEKSEDYLYLPTLDLRGAKYVKMSFDRAHARYNSNYEDRLDIEGSKDCGKTWISLWSKKGAALATAPNSTSEFKPTATQWATDVASIDYFAGDNDVIIRFRSISDYGNNLYIDNILVEATDTSNGGPPKPTSVINIDKNKFISIYPNPAHNFIQISLFPESVNSGDIKIYDDAGNLVSSFKLETLNSLSIDISGYAAGIYTICVNSDEGLLNKRFCVIR
ncbi:MAG: Omp28-related outer membrane protein [Chitinophagales bacterium]|nr:Omp28-related outer membrane protein [Chitinophagales bacterium]MDW8274041.1 Omp28-related outer membrane protein [Chitinophagales bacterium]